MQDLVVKLSIGVCCDRCGVPTAYYDLVTKDGAHVDHLRVIGGVPAKSEHPEAEPFFRTVAQFYWGPSGYGKAYADRIDWDASDFSEAVHEWDW